MNRHPLDFNTRQALRDRLGDAAGREIADLILRLSRRVEELERNRLRVPGPVSHPHDGPPGDSTAIR